MRLTIIIINNIIIIIILDLSLTPQNETHAWHHY